MGRPCWPLLVNPTPTVAVVLVNVYMPPRIQTVSPAAAAICPRPTVANGAIIVPAAESLPPGATKNSAARAGAAVATAATAPSSPTMADRVAFTSTSRGLSGKSPYHARSGGRTRSPPSLHVAAAPNLHADARRSHA